MHRIQILQRPISALTISLLMEGNMGVKIKSLDSIRKIQIVATTDKSTKMVNERES